MHCHVAGLLSTQQQEVEEAQHHSIDALHVSLKCLEVAGRDALAAAILAHFLSFLEPRGVLQLLYSVVLTRGIDRVTSDQGIDAEPLVSLPHGHANQSLINLMITGRATPYVWDNAQDAGGLGGFRESNHHHSFRHHQF